LPTQTTPVENPVPYQQKPVICRKKTGTQLHETHGYAQGFPQGMGVRIGARPLALRRRTPIPPNGKAVNTTSTGGTMSETELETTEETEETEVEHPVDPLPGQTEIEQPDQNDDDDA